MKAERRLVVLGTSVALAFASALAHAVLSINEPWVRAAPDGREAEVFLKLKSSDRAALIGLDSFAARTSAIRALDGKRAASTLALPANVLVELKPGDIRIVLSGLVRRLKQGEHVPVTLIVRTADGTPQKIYVNAEVRQHSPTEDELNPHAHRHPGG